MPWWRRDGRQCDGRARVGRPGCRPSADVHQGQVRGAHQPSAHQRELDCAGYSTPKVTAYPAGWSRGEHTHGVSLIMTLVTGRMEFIFAGHRVVVEPGDELLYPANTVHAARNIHDGTTEMMESHKRWLPSRVRRMVEDVPSRLSPASQPGTAISGALTHQGDTLEDEARATPRRCAHPGVFVNERSAARSGRAPPGLPRSSSASPVQGGGRAWPRPDRSTGRARSPR